MQTDLFELGQAYMENLLNLGILQLPNERQAWMEYTTGLIPAFIYSQEKSEHFFSALQNLQPSNIYTLNDDFGFHMLFAYQPGGFLVCGPFLPEHPGEQFVQGMLERNNANISLLAPLRLYYGSLPIVEPTAAITGLRVLLQAELGRQEQITVKDLYSPEVERHALLFPQQQSNEMVLQLEQRVSTENQLLAGVQAGDMDAALAAFRMLRLEVAMLAHTADTVRHQKNLCHILDSLLRKAAEQAGVAPFYFDALFWDYIHWAERLSTASELTSLRQRMVEDYVRLVLDYSVGGHSLLIQRALNYIHIHLGSPLSLGGISAAIHVSRAHLSAEFNREIGVSLPVYINRRRVDKMAALLSTTHHSVGEIAGYVGFSSSSYASRLFKEAMGVTPGEYRQGLYM